MDFILSDRESLSKILSTPHLGDKLYGDDFRVGDPIGTMMPGKAITRYRQFSPGVSNDDSRPVLWFRDAAGVNWQVDKNGDLRDLTVPDH